MNDRFEVIATNILTGETIVLFTFTGMKKAAIERAKRESVMFGMADKLTDFDTREIL